MDFLKNIKGTFGRAHDNLTGHVLPFLGREARLTAYSMACDVLDHISFAAKGREAEAFSQAYESLARKLVPEYVEAEFSSHDKLSGPH